jgi:adenylate cyclase
VDNSIEYVKKCQNAPNLPQARPIETFWAILSQRVYRGGWEAKTTKQLKQRINRKLKEINENEPNLIQRLMLGLKSKLRKIADNGVYSIIK